MLDTYSQSQNVCMHHSCSNSVLSHTSPTLTCVHTNMQAASRSRFHNTFFDTSHVLLNLIHGDIASYLLTFSHVPWYSNLLWVVSQKCCLARFFHFDRNKAKKIVLFVWNNFFKNLSLRLVNQKKVFCVSHTFFFLGGAQTHTHTEGTQTYFWCERWDEKRVGPILLPLFFFHAI